MKVIFVRSAKAEKKSDFDGPEPLRPLTPGGLRQADRLAHHLAELPITRVLSSPALRCRQTVSRAARALDLPVEVHGELAKDASMATASELLRTLDAELVLCCCHPELIDALADELDERAIEIERASLEPAKKHADAKPHRLAVLDMGSTSFHMLVADVTRAGHLRPVSRERTMLRLGSVIARRGGVPKAEVKRALEAVGEMRRHARDLGAEQLIAVGTAALRDAANGAEFSARIAETLRVPVRLLSGEEEARVIFGAFRRRVVLPRGPSLGVDLGGGSLELAVGDDHGLLFEETLPVGVTRLHGEIVERDPMKKREARAICERVRAQLEPVAASVRGLGPALCVAAGGTARALGDLAVGLRGLDALQSINELVLPTTELREITERLVSSSHEDRLRMPGMRSRRADLLPTGGLILVTIAEVLGLDGYTICDWGLREGILLETVARIGQG